MRLLLELARLRQATAREVREAVVLEPGDLRYQEELLATGRGYLMASAHVGNWEWLGAWTALTYGRVGVVYKPMHNPRTDAIAQDLRQRFGLKIFSTRERVPRELFAHIRGGGSAAILADQDARRRGRFIPFFGHPASTSVGLASLALRLRVPILPGFCVRDERGRFRIKLYPPLWPDPRAEHAAEEERLMNAYHRCLEDVIRQAPEQYFWWHRRWKTQPRPAAPQPNAECEVRSRRPTGPSHLE
jgi:KDO2-lipid IV(A) lauroyltransferase